MEPSASASSSAPAAPTAQPWDSLPDNVKQHYPWPGEYFTTASGHQQHYLDEGSGDPMLMVHGNPTWSFYYRRLVQHFSSTHRCVVPDHIGCGLSEMPEDWTYRLQDHIDNLVALIDHLDLKDITLLVHDWGGAIGFGAALARPDRIKRLVVFNTAVFMEKVPWSIRFARKPLVGETMVRGLNAFIRASLLWNLTDRGRLGDGVGEGYGAPYKSFDKRVGHLRFIRDIPLEDGHPTRETIERLDRDVVTLADRPTVFIWGDKDFVFTPRFLHEHWLKKFPEAEVHQFEDAAHWVVEDAHERIVPIVEDFLARHP